MLRAAVKTLIPGSLLFLAVGLAVGVLLLFGPPRVARWGRRWLAVLVSLYCILSLQGTSDLLVFGLSRGYRAFRTADDARGARVVVVLSNGAQSHQANGQEVATVNLQSAYNALEAARVYRLLGNPLVLASGGTVDAQRTDSENKAATPEGEVMARALEQLGVSRGRIAVESTSRTTYEQAVNVGAWLQAHGERRVVLVTAPEHMRRAAGALAARGVEVVPSPSNIQYGGPPFWRPTEYALAGSRSAIYEYLALSFYRLRGWL